MHARRARSLPTTIRPRNSSAGGVAVSDAGIVTYHALLLSALAGKEPWAAILSAANKANYDYIYNHTPGNALAKATNANIGLYNWGPNELITWDGALELWQQVDYLVKHGAKIDFKSHPLETSETVNAIVAQSQTPQEQVWAFVVHLDTAMREMGSPSYLNPGITEKETPLPNLDLALWLILGGAALLYILPRFRK